MSFDETTEPEPTVWEITRDGIDTGGLDKGAAPLKETLDRVGQMLEDAAAVAEGDIEAAKRADGGGQA